MTAERESGVSALTLRVEPEPDGGWRLGLSLRDGFRHDGRAAPEPAAAALAASAALPQRGEALPMLERNIVRWDDQERAAGRALGLALASDVLFYGRLCARLGALGSQGETVLLVDAKPPLHTLPWELLDLGEGPLEQVGGVLVARTLPVSLAGPAALAERRRLAVRVWAPGAEDEVVRATRAAVVAEAAAAGVPVLSQRDDQVATVLHGVAHGLPAGRQVVVALEAGLAATALDVAASLADEARAALITVLWSCHGAAPTEEELGTLAQGLIAIGASVVLAPRVEVPERWAAPASGALLRQLVQGATLCEALRAARQSVRCQQAAHPHRRARNLQVLVGAGCADRLGWRLQKAWAPEGWPRPAEDLAELLERAAQIAVRYNHDFIGLEHLARSLLDQPRVSGLSAIARDLLARRERSGQEISKALERLVNRASWPGPGGELRPTPRLQRWGLALNHGATLDDLWQIAAQDRSHRYPELVLAVAPPELKDRGTTPLSSGGDLLELLPSWPRGAAPTRLLLLGGPEDGRVLVLAPRQTVGRLDPTDPAEHLLYHDTSVEDRYVSRPHLRWVKPGQVSLLAPATRERPGWGRIQAHRGETMELGPGDILVLSRSTALLALGDDAT